MGTSVQVGLCGGVAGSRGGTRHTAQGTGRGSWAALGARTHRVRQGGLAAPLALVVPSRLRAWESGHIGLNPRVTKPKVRTLCVLEATIKRSEGPMSDLVQPNLTPSQWRQLRVLEYLYDEYKKVGRSSSVEVGFNELEDELGRDEIQAAVPALIQSGYVWSEPNLAGYPGAFLQPAGQDVVEQVRARRTSTVERNKAVRDAVLYWIYDQGTGASPDIGKFEGSEKYNSFYGDTFTYDEITHATTWLKNEGYITGTATNYGGIPRPSITSRGTRVVENDGSVNAPQASPGSQIWNTHFHGNAGNVAMGSSHFTQNSVISTELADGMSDVVAAVREVVELLASHGVDPAALEDALGELDQAGSQKEDAGPLRVALTKLQSTLANGAGSAVGRLILGKVEELLGLVHG